MGLLFFQANWTMDLNKIVTTIQGLSGTEADLKQLKTHLTKAEEVLVKNLALLDDALSSLDPSRHSLGWLFILYEPTNVSFFSNPT